jgi:peptidoglycan/xylan/chitin deacetylase (PgdA/CDA1 family)
MRLLRSLSTRAFLHSGAAALTRRLQTHRVLVLRYHSVCADTNREPPYVSPSISLPMAIFDRQMEYVVKNYRPLTLTHLVRALRTGTALSPLSVVVTFDDGYVDNYLFALPVLKKHRVPATVFLVSSTLTEHRLLWTSRLRYALSRTKRNTLRICDPAEPQNTVSLRTDTAGDRALAARTLTNLLNRLPMSAREKSLDEVVDQCGVTRFPHVEEWFLSADQIREALSSDIEFGAHTVSHPNLPGIPSDEAKREIFQCKTDLESHIGCAVPHFSYPNSGALHAHFDEGVTAQVVASGYESAVTSVDGWIDEGTNPFRLSRISMNRSWGPLHRFASRLESMRLSRASNMEVA